jgi:hypothetical protein
MKQKQLMILLSIVALVFSSFMITGNAGAMYQSDGAVQNGTTGGWTAPTDGICVLDIHPDGTLDVDATITTKRDCDARLVAVTGVTGLTATQCTTTAGNGTGFKYAAPGGSTCVTIDGSGNVTGSISMVNNDRNETICEALGTAQGKTAHLANNAAVKSLNGYCLAYTYVFRGQDSNGNPLPFGYTGNALSDGTVYGTDSTVTPNTGFCYTSMATSIAAASCPTVVGSATGTKTATAAAALPYSSSASTCSYSYAIAGKLSAALLNVNGSTAVIGGVTASVGATVDLSNLTTYGQCVANGGSWSNWIPLGSAAHPATIGTISGDTNITKAVTFDVTRQAVNSDNGCTHCHSTLVQYNADVYRQKNSYLMTGHKNMLRKVTPGMVWAGPSTSGVLTVYTTDGTNPMTWGTLGVPNSALDGSNPMYYIYGDWMALYPDVAIAGSNYGCANCHSTGFSGGTAATPGVQSIGTAGYAGTQPADAGAAYVSAVKAGYQWDLEGINCSRCHNATAPAVTQAMIYGGSCAITSVGSSAVCAAEGGKWNSSTSACTGGSAGNVQTSAACVAAGGTWTAVGTASAYLTTASTSSGMGALASGAGRNNLCFGCHQSIAKLWPAQGTVDGIAATVSGSTVTAATQYDPTIVPAKITRDFSGHVNGNNFLNSVHARYTGAQSGQGSIKANSLGENDLTDPNGITEYNSIFQGYQCYQGSGSNDVAVHDASGNPLNTAAACNALYGAGSWKVDTNGTQGTCTTCHDVHNSLFIASQAGSALKKSCADCHVNNVAAVTGPVTGATVAAAPQVASFNHPQTPGTPFDTTVFPNGSCEVCHMATQAEANGNQNSMPAHIWRINTNANYNTFPTATQFYNGTCSVHTGSVVYAWNGVANMNSPQPIYTSDTSSANCVAAAGTWTLASSLTPAVLMDNNVQTWPEYQSNGQAYTDAYGNVRSVWVDLDLACGQCHGGSFGSNATHNNAPYKSKTELAADAFNMHNVTPTASFTSQSTGACSLNPTVNTTQSSCIAAGTCSNGALTQAACASTGSCSLNPTVNTTQTVCTTAGSCSLNPTVNTTQSTCTTAGTCSDGKSATAAACAASESCSINPTVNTNQSLCINAGTCSVLGYTSYAACAGIGTCSVNPTSNTTQAMCASAGTCSDNVSTSAAACISGGSCSLSGYTDLDDCIDAQGIWTPNTWTAATWTAAPGQWTPGQWMVTGVWTPGVWTAGVWTAAPGTWTPGVWSPATTTVNFNAATTNCPSGSCNYVWNFGDPASGTTNNTSTGVTASHTFSASSSTGYPVQLFVYNNTSEAYDFQTNMVTVGSSLIAAESVSTSGLSVTLTDASTAGSSIKINWGDGSAASTGSAGGVFNHTYASANTYTIVDTATANGISASKSQSVTVPATKYTVSGTVTNHADTTVIQSVSLTLKQGAVTKAIASTNASGGFTFINVAPGTYTITANKTGYMFSNPAATVTVTTGNVTTASFSSSN